MKDRTNEEGIDPVTDKPAEDASVRGELESRDGGKHGAPQARIMIEEILSCFWLNYYKLGCTYTVIERLAEWVRRRVRLYYWKPA